MSSAKIKSQSLGYFDFLIAKLPVVYQHMKGPRQYNLGVTQGFRIYMCIKPQSMWKYFPRYIKDANSWTISPVFQKLVIY